MADRPPDDAAIVEAATRAGDGYSVDEILIRGELRRSIRESFDPPLDDDQARQVFDRMMTLRKTSRWPVETTRRGGGPMDGDVLAAAEIAARAVTDRHRVATDDLLVDPSLNRELVAEARGVLRGVDGDDVRRAVLSLRKRRRLRPELVLRVADWNRVVTTHTHDELASRLSAGEVSTGPGVYLFRSAEGYLYIGEAANLRRRLSEHFDGSDRESLADHLRHSAGETTIEIHAFAADSPARKVSARRAYESELIRSRKPKFNVRP